jgi:serine/threonine protein kinase
MGDVFLATDRTNGEKVIIKAPINDNPEVLRRFRREIEEQSKIRSPYVMPILDWGPGMEWFCMPLAAGTLLELAPEMSPEEIVRAIDHVAQGLAVAHEAGNVHRDVKPSNILVFHEEEADRWVISDFGLVRRPPGQTTKLTALGVGAGTSGYMAPETIGNASSADARADVFSLGRTIVFAVTGLDPEKATLSDVPEEWRPLALSMTQPVADDRPDDMDAVREGLRLVLNRVKKRRRGDWGRRKQALDMADHEVVVLQAVVQASTTDTFGVESAAFNDIDQVVRGFNSFAVKLALSQLTAGGFLTEERGQFALTEFGWAWLKENTNRLHLKTSEDGWR